MMRVFTAYPKSLVKSILAVSALICFLSQSQSVKAQVSGDYRTVTSASGSWATIGNWQSYNGSAWVAAGSAPTSANGAIEIRSDANITVSANTTVDQVTVNGILEVSANTLTIANGAAVTDIQVTSTGTIKFSGTGALTLTGTLNIANGGTLEWARNATLIASLGSGNATYGTSSNFRITGITNTTTFSFTSEDFGNIEWNCPSQTVTNNWGGTLNGNITGNLTIANTGSGKVQLNSGNTTYSLPGNLTIADDVEASSSGTTTLGLVGNLSVTGTLTEGGASTTTLNFEKFRGTQYLLSDLSTNWDNININGTSTALDLGTYQIVFTAAGKTLTLLANRWLITANLNGLFSNAFSAISTTNSPTLDINTLGAKIMYNSQSVVGPQIISALDYGVVYINTGPDLMCELEGNANIRRGSKADTLFLSSNSKFDDKGFLFGVHGSGGQPAKFSISGNWFTRNPNGFSGTTSTSITSTATEVILNTGSTVTYIGTVNQTISIHNSLSDGNASYYNLTLAGNNNKTLAGALSIQGGGTVRVLNDATLDVGTNVISQVGTGTVGFEIWGKVNTTNTNGFAGSASTTINSSNTSILLLGGSTIIYAATGAQAVQGNGTLSLVYGNVRITGGTTAKTLSSNIHINGGDSLIIDASNTLNMAGFTMVQRNTGTASFVLNGILNTSNTNGFSGGASTTITSTNTSVVCNTGSTVNYNGTTQAVTTAHSYANLVFTNSGTKTAAAGTITVTGTIETQGTAVLDLSTSTLSLAGNGTFLASSLNSSNGSLIITGSSTMNIGGASALFFNFNSLTVTGALTLVNDSIQFTNGVSLTGTGTFNPANNVVRFGGNWTSYGTAAFTEGTSIIKYIGTGTGTLTTTGGENFTSLRVMAGTLALGSNVAITGQLAVSNASHFNTASSQVTGTGGFHIAASCSLSTARTAGISNAIGVSGTRTFIAGANYLFNTPSPSAASSTGFSGLTIGVPTRVVINSTNTSGVSLDVNNFSVTNVNVNSGAYLNMPSAVSFLESGTGAVVVAGTVYTAATSGFANASGSFRGYTSPTDFTMTGSTVVYNGAGANITSGTYNELRIAAANQVLQSGTTNAVNITVESGGTLTATTGAALNISGNWTNNNGNSGLNGSTFTITFNGTGAQSITSTTNESFNAVTVNKASGTLSLGCSTTIGGTLTLTAGALSLNGNELYISTQSTSAITRTAGYIQSESNTFAGRIKWNMGAVAGTYTFPFANASGSYIPFTVALTSGNIGNLTLSTYASAADNTPLPPTVTQVNNIVGGNNSAFTVDRYWSISKDGVGGVANVTFRWAAAEAPTLGSGTFRAQRWGGSTWEYWSLGQVTGSNSVTINSLSSFSTWAVVDKDNPLPVSMHSMNARLEESKVNLNWATASENNSQFFGVERSMDGKNFVQLGKVDAKGFSTSLSTYTFVDETLPNLKNAVVYYRLVQTDRDGQTELYSFNPIRIGAADVRLSIYPIPAQDRLEVSIENAGITNLLEITDLTGKVFYNNTETLGKICLPVQNLSEGIYLLRLNSDGTIITKRFYKTR